MREDRQTQWIGVAAAAKRLGISRAQLYNMKNPTNDAYLPDFPCPIKLGKRTLFLEEELEAWQVNHAAANRMPRGRLA